MINSHVVVLIAQPTSLDRFGLNIINIISLKYHSFAHMVAFYALQKGGSKDLFYVDERALGLVYWLPQCV